MKLKSTVLILVMMSVLMLTTFNGVPVVSQVIEPPIVPASEWPESGPFEKYGPRVDRLIFDVGGSVMMEHDDFDAGMIDVMDWSAEATRWEDWLADPDITMGEYSECAAQYLAFNVARWPLGHGDMLAAGSTEFPDNWQGDHADDLWKKNELWPDKVNYPMDGNGTADWCYFDENCRRCLDARQFRRGIAHLVDRPGQITYMAGAGEALEPSLYYPPLKEFWENPKAATYPFGLDKASAAFVAGGFKKWKTGDDTMYYSPGHDGNLTELEDVPVIDFYTRQDDDHRKHLGEVISGYMKALKYYECGELPHKLIIATSELVDTNVWYYYTFDIYIEYWDWGAYPDLYYYWFSSDQDIYPIGYANNDQRHHNLEYDEYAEAFMTAPNIAAAKEACDKMQEIIHRDAVAVPIYHYVSYNAHRTTYGSWPGEEKYADRNWTGMCNRIGEGFYTYTGGWTPLNAHLEGFEKGGTLRQGLNIEASNLDPLDAEYFYDGLVLTQIYDTLIRPNPWNVTAIDKYEPWLCEDYTPGTWEMPDVGNCTAFNFTLIPGILWQDGTPMTAEDVGFSFWFHREAMSVTYADAQYFEEYVTYDTNDVIPGNETIEIRFNVLSWLATYWCSAIVILPKHVWEPVGPAGSFEYVPEDHDTVFGTGPFRFYKDGIVGRVDRVIGEYLYLERNPNYFRRLVRPDFCGIYEVEPNVWKTLPIPDANVSMTDFGTAMGQFGYFDPYWRSLTFGPLADVNKDLVVDIDDLMEIATRFGEKGYIEGYPAYYAWSS